LGEIIIIILRIKIILINNILIGEIKKIKIKNTFIL